MATTTNLNIRTDKDIKEAAEHIFNELGISMTTAVNIFLRQTIRNNGIPFELKLNTPNETTRLALAEYEEIKQHPEKYKRYDTFQDALDEVFADA